ncbi:hypothetical protein [Streptomyces palmae]|uniref:Uncharacterized protein n=1 Tax=Streptomyces palmae TaxID=1701085 RepID=A0A4Z0H994_9ACTN|nr:hypothetical protein [Streptomyces palmae]TGB08950.1 hypothetical protein E4099_14510 [Streptomyces palmae]
MVDEQESGDEAIEIPARVCHGRISAESVPSLFPASGEKFREYLKNFDEAKESGSCHLWAGKEVIFVEYREAPFSESHRKKVQRFDTPVTLGDAWGYMTESGWIDLYLPCTTKSGAVESRLKVGAVAVTVHASVVVDTELNEANKKLQALAEFAAEAGRDLHGWYGCEGPKLADGPVSIDWSKRP